MEENRVLVDTTLFIEFFRKQNKEKSKLIFLADKGHKSCISAVTEFEIYAGAMGHQRSFWDNFLRNIEVLPFDNNASKSAAMNYLSLKQKNKLIDLADLFIAATAIANNLSLTTLNKKHFERIKELDLVELP